MSILHIGEVQQAALNRIAKWARLNPVDATKAITLPEALARKDNRDHSVELPVGYSVTVTQEMQPFGGLFWHVSVSIDRPGKLPAPEAVNMILKSLGLKSLDESAMIWMERFAPNQDAVNVLQKAETVQ